MSLLKSKEILDLNIKEVGSKMPADTLKAIILGAEAIEAIVECRKDNCFSRLRQLPSETNAD